MPCFSHIKTKQKSSWLYFPNSYHPISLFPFVAKLKRVVYTQYYKFFSLSLSWNNPVRFSPNNSPESALVKIDKRLLNPTFSAQSSPSLTLIQHLTQMITASSLIHFLPSHTLPDFPATSLYLFSFLCWLVIPPLLISHCWNAPGPNLWSSSLSLLTQVTSAHLTALNMFYMLKTTKYLFPAQPSPLESQSCISTCQLSSLKWLTDSSHPKPNSQATSPPNCSILSLPYLS